MANTKPLLLILLSAAVAGSALAQEKKIYRWVDKDGKVQISDQLPPDMVDKARKEYNAKTGDLKTDVKSQLSPAEQAAANQQAAEEVAAQAAIQKAKRIEQGMLVNYETEQDLQRSFDERTDLLKQTIVSLKASIQSRRAALISTLNILAELELKGEPAPADKLKWLETNHAVLKKQVAQMARMNVSYTEIQGEFALILEKYRQMKGIAAPATPETATTAPEAVGKS
jgi:Domain of unknown function (DUF4124)